MKYLLVGLGNPGKRYENTRHNLGFLAVNEFIKSVSAEKVNEKIQAGFWRAHKDGDDILIIEPETYMNESGRVVSPFLRLKGIPEERLIVVHDDLDLPLGKIRVSTDASAGGHNGVKSVIENLGSKNFIRLRLGIGRPADGSPIDEFVLGKFSPEEKAILPQIIDNALAELEKIFSK